VIKVEGCAHPDWWRGWNGPEAGDPPPYEMRPSFNAVNRNKRGITLDLRSSRGCEIVRRLAVDADLLIENYAPGVLDRLGLSAEALAKINPNLVYISMGAFGSAGPWSEFRAYGSTTEQASGLPFINGAPEWAPCLQHIAYGDPIAGIYAAAASLVALFGRQATGGTTIDLSQVECLFQLAADAIIAQSATGATPARNGSRRTTSFWRGCLQAAGKDAWVAVDVTKPARLESFLREAGMNPPASATADHLAAMLETWTMRRSSAVAADALQEAGIAAGPVLPAHALLEDPHLKSSGFWRRIERRYVGDHVVPKAPFAIDGMAPALYRPSPTLGQHNEEVLRDVLGLPPAEIQALERDGIIGTRPT
jgi:crotonobetainyl-CoA:carnitine CoA-transferase CaiB-like acyl-CoA transferase